MQGKIIPKITSKDNRLIFSETLCVFYEDGVNFELPLSGPEKKNEYLIIQLNFCNIEGDSPSFKLRVDNQTDTLTLTLINFENNLGIGTTSPIEFQIGTKSYFILLYSHYLRKENPTSKNLLHLTITMYGG